MPKLHKEGYAVFVLRYSIWLDLSDNAPLQDLGNAVRYITDHAQEFDVQPEKYAIVGYSSGGHLAGLFGSEKAYGIQRMACAKTRCADPGICHQRFLRDQTGIPW